MQIGEFRFLDETATLSIDIYMLTYYRIHFLTQLVSSFLLHLLQFFLLLVNARLEKLRHRVHGPFGLLRDKHECITLLQILLSRLLHFRVDQARRGCLLPQVFVKKPGSGVLLAPWCGRHLVICVGAFLQLLLDSR